MKDKKESRMSRLWRYLLLVAVLAGTVFPSSVSANGVTESGYVLVKRTAYNVDGTLSGYYEYEYDTYGNWIKYTGYMANGIMMYCDVMEYDKNGNMTKMTEYANNGTVRFCYEYEYDAYGNQTIFRSGGSLMARYENEYDTNGNMIKRTSYGAGDSIEGFFGYEYDASGNLIKETYYRANGTVNFSIGYEYDVSGNLVKETSYDAKGIAGSSEVYEYDTSGKQIKYTSYGEDGTVSQIQEYEYDAYGNQIKSIYYKWNGSIWVINIYEYALLKDVGTMPEPEGGFASYEGFSFYKDTDGNITCIDSEGVPVINEFKCDGTYTYFFQADGTAMTDRLSYHPDGKHVIYFDSNGHEVFSDFANVRKTIAGDSVDDFCFFDVYGYLYVDVVTYDKTGTVLYYANPYGVMERGKWFQFSDTVKCADGTPWAGAAGRYGYANADGTLMKDQWTYDWEGRYCYMQGNGAALYE